MKEAAAAVTMIDLEADDFRRDPYPLYRRLRHSAPLARVRGYGWWALSRHADVDHVLRDPQRFSSAAMAAADPVLLGADAPRHERVRRLARAALGCPRIRQLPQLAAEEARRLVRRLCAEGGGDLVSDYAAELPVWVLARLLDLDPAVVPELGRWCRAVGRGPGARDSAGGAAAGDGSAGHLDALLAAVVAERQRQPGGDDLLTALCEAGEADDRLAPAEIAAVTRILLLGGIETTAHLIGNALLAVLSRRWLGQQVRREPQCAAAVVSETLRHDSPVQVVLRRTATAVALHGQPLPGGAVLALLLGSAGRDERRFDEPERFRLGRTLSDDLAFGAGPHRCLGAGLAFREAAVALETLWAAGVAIRPTADLEGLPRARSVLLRGVGSLPVVLAG